MPRIQKILFPVDLSPRCAFAAPSVRHWTEQFTAELTLLHCVNLPPAAGRDYAPIIEDRLLKQVKSGAEESLRAFAEHHFPDLRPVLKVINVEPGWGVADHVRDQRDSLIMMPTHGYGAFRRFLVGSVTAKTLHDADCPVWTTAHAEGAHGRKVLRPGTILCGLDRTPAAVNLLRWSAWLAKQFQAKLQLVHALPAVDETSMNRGERAVKRHWMAQAKEELGPLLEKAGCDAELTLRGGSIPDVLADAARASKAGLLVIGRGHSQRKMGRLRTHSLGIVGKSPCPVLSI